MPADPAPTLRITADEYLAMERIASEKHEYFEGEVFAMAGASPRHNLIVGNVIALVWGRLRGGPCRVYPSDLKVHVPATGLYAYPDVSVVCGPLEVVGPARDIITNPRIVVEVLSETTERFDRGLKFASYRALPSVREVLLVSQEEARIEHYARQPDGSWLLREAQAGGAVTLASVGCTLSVDEVYLGAFDEPPTAADVPATA